MVAVRATMWVLIALTVAGCAGEQLSLGSSAPAPAEFSMPGRWLLTAPNSPSCGMEFNGAPGAHSGRIAPDGGCPGAFYMSRRWAMEGNSLTITDDENQPLAQFKFADTRFEGQSASGIPVALAR